jgi:uncharacterized protein YceH (UPF0502 family)
MDMELSAIEVRVLGCLIEKERTTPEYYPLTQNSLLAACNQKSNRDPEMALTKRDVEEALESLHYQHNLVATVTQANSRVLKYRHQLLSHYKFDAEDIAVLCELMLRGPQTAGELRTHTKRMVDIQSPAQVKEILDGLRHWGDVALVQQLPPAKGMREQRYAHLLGAETPLEEAEPAEPTESVATQPDANDRITALETKVADLEARLTALEDALR